MGSLRGTLLLCALLLVAAPLAAAQEDPTVNESDMDTSDPGYDESYLDDGGNATAAGEENATSYEDPTLSEGDFDMGAPPADESYLGDAAASDASAGSAETFGPGLALAMAAALIAALALHRR